jgi:hypothetical protein
MEPSDLLGEAFLIESVTAVQYRENRAILAACLLLCGRNVGVPNGFVGACGRDRCSPCRHQHGTKYERRGGVHGMLLSVASGSLYAAVEKTLIFGGKAWGQLVRIISYARDTPAT